jgi:hypothetical protein
MMSASFGIVAPTANDPSITELVRRYRDLVAEVRANDALGATATGERHRRAVAMERWLACALMDVQAAIATTGAINLLEVTARLEALMGLISRLPGEETRQIERRALAGVIADVKRLTRDVPIEPWAAEITH